MVCYLSIEFSLEAAEQRRVTDGCSGGGRGRNTGRGSMDQLQNAETLGQVGTTSMDRPLDAAVIGAGWAGLGVSYALAEADLSHRVLERGRIGETWLTQRWDSF